MPSSLEKCWDRSETLSGSVTSCVFPIKVFDNVGICVWYHLPLYFPNHSTNIRITMKGFDLITGSRRYLVKSHNGIKCYLMITDISEINCETVKFGWIKPYKIKKLFWLLCNPFLFNKWYLSVNGCLIDNFVIF